MKNDKNSEEKKRKLKLVEKFNSDDYSRYAGPDFEEGTFEIGEKDFNLSPYTNKSNINLRGEGRWNHPGVSGKTDDGETWVNQREYKEQTDFTGFAPRGYIRTDDRIYEEVCETLMRHREVDATNIAVKVEKGTVFLSGKVSSRRMKKTAELIIEDLPGVQDVRNELTIIRGDEKSSGPESATRKDLGF